MSRFFSEKYSSLVPYTPGEQPKDMKYIKLNTNESPFPPSEKAISAASEAIKILNLYSDPESRMLTEKVAAYYGLDYENVLMTNGSDEILYFAFTAFCDKNTPAVFPDITYGFYPVYSEFLNIPYREIPLKEDFTINVNDYLNANGTVFIANPNAPTGEALFVNDIRRIVEANPDNVVVIDEAYIDFGGESCVPLVKEYDNLLVTQTFSKSRSLAGARLGMGMASKGLIQDLNTVKYSVNPYNVNRMTSAAGYGAMSDDEYTKKNCRYIEECREYTSAKLKELGFEMTDSKANFIFAKHPRADGKEIYLKLKEKGILIRHFDKERICQYNRITVGTKEQMDALINALTGILEELK